MEYMNGIIPSRFQHVKVAGNFKGPLSPMVWREDGLEGLPSGNDCYIAIENGHL